MDIRELIPKHKDDQKVIEELRKLSFEEIKPIIPDLLEWLQDMNWPIARPVADILQPFSDRIIPDIIRILKTNDDVWKLWILTTLAITTKDETLLKQINRIAKYPTKGEIENEVNIQAIAILDSDYDWYYCR